MCSLLLLDGRLVLLEHTVAGRWDEARAVGILDDVALADQIGEDVGGGAVVVNALSKPVTLCLDRVVLSKFLLDVQLLLLGDCALSINLLLGAAAL